MSDNNVVVMDDMRVVSIETETHNVVVSSSEQGVAGINGLSAYQVAVANGFVGTEQDWLASLGGGGGGSTTWNSILNKPDLSAFQDYLNTTLIVFNHDLRKYPAVYIEDTGGNRWSPKTIDYPTLAQVIITFDNIFSGRVTLS